MTPLRRACARGRRGSLPTRAPQGLESVFRAAARCGVDDELLVKILARAEVKVHRGESPGQHGYRRSFVDPSEVNEALRRWLETETVGAAARARGLLDTTLRRWLLAAGEQPPAGSHRGVPWRLPSRVIDRVVAERRPGTRRAA